MKTNLRLFGSLGKWGFMLSIATAIGLFFQQCEKDESDYEYNLRIPEEYNQVGRIHNEGVDYVLASIQDYWIEQSSTNGDNSLGNRSIDYNEVARQAMSDFFKQNSQTKDFISLFESTSKGSELNEKSSPVIELEPIQIELMTEIQQALKAEMKSKNVKRLKGKLDKINISALERLTENDAGLIYCATSTAYSTFQYWTKNYRAWYFSLHYPELLDQYDKEELNGLKLKGSLLSLDTIPGQPGTIKRVWDYLEGWYTDFSDDVNLWWDTYGEGIVISDCLGALKGGTTALATAGPESLVFGPEGLVIVGISGAIIGSVQTSVEAAVVSGLIEIGKE